MKKLINDPEAFVEETIEGLLLAHGHHLKRVEGTPRGLMRADAPVEGGGRLPPWAWALIGAGAALILGGAYALGRRKR